MAKALASAGLVVAAASIAVAIVSSAARSQTAPALPPDVAQARIVAGTARLYDTSILHVVRVELAADAADRLVARTDTREHARITIDGQTLRDVGVRQSGGIYHPYQPITNKPSLSLKFDEFVKGQRLSGLSKLILKNELQDVSFLSEHLTYEIFRRAGLAAPLTAHALVSINGIDSGLYVMREPINKQFLARNFGSAETGGDLYEIENTQDFVRDPSYPALDDEGVNGRTREKIVRLARAVQAATPDTFTRDISPLIDLDRFVTYVAAELATGHWDGFVSRNNNTYMYARLRDGKFIFIPYGADQALGISRSSWGGGMGGGWAVQSMIVRRMLAVPALADRVEAEVARIQGDVVWNAAVLTERIERVSEMLGSIDGASGRTASDLARFAAWRPAVVQIVQPPRTASH